MRSNEEKVIAVIIESKTALEALQIGAASCPYYDKQIKEGNLPIGIYWTRTGTAYMKPGVPFGKTATYTDPSTGEVWRIAVPRKFQGKKDRTLLFNISKDEVSKEGNTVVLKPRKIAMKPIAKEDGWHLPDEFCFPSGKESNIDNQEARKLWRRTNEGYVGLLARYFDDFYIRRYVYADDQPSYRFGVLTEEQAGVCPNLKPLALDAEKELTELRGTVKEEKLTRIAALVEAAMQ